MHRIYLGYFTETDTDKLHAAFDIDGEFMRVLAKDYLEDGCVWKCTRNKIVLGFLIATLLYKIIFPLI